MPQLVIDQSVSSEIAQTVESGTHGPFVTESERQSEIDVVESVRHVSSHQNREVAGNELHVPTTRSGCPELCGRS